MAASRIFMVNLDKADGITKVSWELIIQMLMDKQEIQGFNKVKDSKDFKAFEKWSRRRMMMRKRYNSQSAFLKS